MRASIRGSMSPTGKGGRVGEMQSFFLEMCLYYGDGLNIWQHFYLSLRMPSIQKLLIIVIILLMSTIETSLKCILVFTIPAVFREMRKGQC